MNLNLPTRACPSGQAHAWHTWDSPDGLRWCIGVIMESDLRDRTIEPPTTDNRCVWVKVGQVPCDRHGPVELLCSTCKEKHPAPPPVAEWPADTPLALDAEAWEVES